MLMAVNLRTAFNERIVSGKIERDVVLETDLLASVHRCFTTLPCCAPK